MSEIIRVRCGGCDVKIKAPLKYQGRRVNCPQCGHEVRIPVVDAAAGSSAAAKSPAPSKAVAPVLISPAESESPRLPTRSAAAKPVLVNEESATVLGDDAFVDRKPAAKKKPADDELANIDFADYEDYGPIEDYGAPVELRAKPRDDSPRPRKKKRKKAKSSGGGIYIDPAVYGGLALMLFGGGIFAWLWSRGIIWPWAGIICIAGLIGVVKGLLGIDDD